MFNNINFNIFIFQELMPTFLFHFIPSLAIKDKIIIYSLLQLYRNKNNNIKVNKNIIIN